MITFVVMQAKITVMRSHARGKNQWPNPTMGWGVILKGGCVCLLLSYESTQHLFLPEDLPAKALQKLSSSGDSPLH